MDPRRRALLAALAAGTFVKGTQAAEPAARAIPSSGEKLPVIGLGTWQSFDVGQAAAARAPLRAVLEEFARGGGRMVDSSPMYGAAESVVGDLVAELGTRERLFIATKVWTRGREDGLRQMEASFRRLRVERMDLMQIHNLVDAGTHAKTLIEMKSQGRLRYIGITHYSASAYSEVERWLKAAPWDFLQINYSLGERDAEARLLPLAQEGKIAVIVNRPFAEGHLFAKTRGKPLPAWAGELGIASWAQYYLKWIVSHPAVTCAIPGTSKPQHMQDNLGAGYGSLPDAAARKRMADYFASL